MLFYNILFDRTVLFVLLRPQLRVIIICGNRNSLKAFSNRLADERLIRYLNNNMRQ